MGHMNDVVNRQVRWGNIGGFYQFRPGTCYILQGWQRHGRTMIWWCIWPRKRAKWASLSA